jgi:hypothetical protein
MASFFPSGDRRRLEISSDGKVASCLAADLSSDCNHRVPPTLVLNEEQGLAIASETDDVGPARGVRIAKFDRLAGVEILHDQAQGGIRRRLYQTNNASILPSGESRSRRLHRETSKSLGSTPVDRNPHHVCRVPVIEVIHGAAVRRTQRKNIVFTGGEALEVAPTEVRCKRVSSALYTTPMPPPPSFSITR